jgi:16S rRNA G966 N2-methylase RsmD
MAQFTLIHGDANDYPRHAEIMLTDPPYELSGKTLANIIDKYPIDHLVMLTTMRQLMEFMAASEWSLNFDFVFDGVAPKKSRSLSQPNYTHQTGVYLTRNGAKSRFNRKRRMRSDCYEENGYWPTIFHAPRTEMNEFGFAKNVECITDLIGSFDAASVIDPFAGFGTTAQAAFELEIECTMIEKDPETYRQLKKVMKFMGRHRLEIIENES